MIIAKKKSKKGENVIPKVLGHGGHDDTVPTCSLAPIEALSNVQ